MKIVFLGDSVTEGCFDIYKNDNGEWVGKCDPQLSYVNLIALRIKKEYPDRDIKVINAGVGGDSTVQVLERLDRDVISEKPDITVVCLTLNNAPADNLPAYIRELSEILGRIKDTGSELIFLTPNMLNSYLAEGTADYLIDFANHCAKIQICGVMDRHVAAGIETAEKYGAVICDAYAVWKKLERYGIDTTALLCNHINHPKPEMHNLFADMLYEILKTRIN